MSTATDTALAIREHDDRLTVRDAWTAEQIDLIKRTVANGANDLQIQLFLEFCLRRGLDPITKQVYWTSRGYIVGIDGMRAKAEETGRYLPDENPARETRDKDGKLLAVEVMVFKWHDLDRQWHRVTERAYLAEYDAGTPNWRKMPTVMLSKCAEARALRKAFPHLSGLYVREEMDQAEAPAPAPAPDLGDDARRYHKQRADLDEQQARWEAEQARPTSTRDRVAAALQAKLAAGAGGSLEAQLRRPPTVTDDEAADLGVVVDAEPVDEELSDAAARELAADAPVEPEEGEPRTRLEPAEVEALVELARRLRLKKGEVKALCQQYGGVDALEDLAPADGDRLCGHLRTLVAAMTRPSA